MARPSRERLAGNVDPLSSLPEAEPLDQSGAVRVRSLSRHVQGSFAVVSSRQSGGDASPPSAPGESEQCVRLLPHQRMGHPVRGRGRRGARFNEQVGGPSERHLVASSPRAHPDGEEESRSTRPGPQDCP